MILNILKRDLKRKRTMNIILLLFIIIATAFVSSGLSNIIAVMNGTDYYLEQAGIDDYVVITQRGDGGLSKILDNEKAVESYKCEYVIFGSDGNLKVGDQKLEIKNTLFVQSIGDSKIKYFDKDNNVIEEIPKGCAYVTGMFFEKNDIETNEVINLNLQGIEQDVKVLGKAKDALLGSDFMGNTRVLMNDDDFQKFKESEELKPYRGNVFYIKSSDTKAIERCISDTNGILFDGERQLIKMCYIMDMIVAFVIVILSICLIAVSFVILKFTITFTISEEYREIGVMKAIGISNGKIRSLYLVKYFALGIVGTIIGFLVSIPFGDILLQSVSENMVLGSNGGLIINTIGAVSVIVIIILFAYACTRKVKKSTPVDAIRSGQSGERYKKKSVYRIGKSHVGNSLYMAINDVISSKKRFVTVIVSFVICSVFTLCLVIVTDTMKSDSLISTFCQKSDVYMTDVNEVMKYMSEDGEDGIRAYLKHIEDVCKEHNMPGKASIELQFKYKILFDGESYKLTCQQGMNTNVENYVFIEGVAPVNDNEVAITDVISKKIGAKIGDEIVIDFGNDGKDLKKYIVTAYFQTMNQLGETIRFNENAPTSFSNIASMMAFQITFDDNPSEKVVENRVEELKKIFDNDDIVTAAGYCADCIGVVDTMEAISALLFTITIVVVILVTILLERTFISDEKSQIALLKAVGFKDRVIIRWHIYRFMIVGLIAELISIVVALPVTKLWADKVFGMMGASDIVYHVDIFKTFVVYPAVILVVTVVTAFITALHTKSITSRDTSNIE